MNDCFTRKGNGATSKTGMNTNNLESVACLLVVYDFERGTQGNSITKIAAAFQVLPLVRLP